MTTTLGPTEEQILTMRHNIMEKIVVAEASVIAERAIPRASTRRRIAFASLGVAAVAAVIVAGVVIPSRGDASAEAATILNDAAALAVTSTDLVAGPGQYLKIATVANYVTGGPDGAWMSPSTYELYKPADPDAEWVLERREQAPTEFFGEESKAAAMADWEWRQSTPSRPTVGIFRAKDAAFYGTPDPAWSSESLPRDPRKLYAYLRSEYNGGSNNPDEDTWGRITALLRTGAAPADLRSALFGAAALLPGIEVIPGVVTLSGRTGIALGRVESSRAERQDIIIDPTTGELIGERTVLTEARGTAAAGTTLSATAVTITVVDTAP